MRLAIIFSLLFLHGNLTAKATGSGNETLNTRQRHIAVIAAFTAKGDQENLRKALHRGLDDGLTINETKEVLIQMYAYCGFPRSLNGLNTLLAVTKERKQKGLEDRTGKDAEEFPKDKSVLEAGTEIQTRLVGRPVTGELYEFAPVIGIFLKSHLFGDIFLRDILNHQEREIATIAALASMKGVENQLRSHLNVGMNTGLSATQLRDLTATLKTQVDKAVGKRAEKLLNNILNSK